MASNTQIATATVSEVDMNELARLMDEQFQVATAGPQLSMDEFATQLTKASQTDEYNNFQQRLMSLFAEFTENLDGMTVHEFVSGEGLTAEEITKRIPNTIFSDLTTPDRTAEDIKARFTRIMDVICNARQELLRRSPSQTETAAEPEEFQGVKRVQTMKPGEEVETMQFDQKKMLTDLVESLGLDEPVQNGDANAALEPYLKMLEPGNMSKLEQHLKEMASSHINETSIIIPVADPKLAEKNFATYRRHVDNFIKAMDDPNATSKTFSDMVTTLTSYPLLFKARVAETLEGAEDIVRRIQDALAAIMMIYADRNLALVKPIITAFASQTAFDEMRKNLLDSTALTKEWNEIEQEIDAWIGKHQKAEAEAEAKAKAEEDAEAENLAADLD